VTYPFNPLDVVGWKGSLYPWKISIYDYCPITSHRYHIPPSGHTMFVAQNFVVCSFVARPLEHTSEGVLKVPFFHSNIDYDEILFYHQGNFFSRDNIDAGAITYHPQGIHHGPHPKAFKSADAKEFTDEFAVMIDTRNPLNMTPEFERFENKEYWKSWMVK
jgi:homogentisate 1,2-dioxygenase